MVDIRVTTPSAPIRQDDESVGSTKEKILRAAATAFADRGFDGATFRDIGADAGVNFQSIRYHFGSKEQLWEAVVERLSIEGATAMREYVESTLHLPLREQVRIQIRKFVCYQARNPELQRILLREAIPGSERYRKAYRKHVARFEEYTGQITERLQREGVIKQDIEVKDLFAVLRGAINYRLVAPGSEDTDGDSRTIKQEVIESHAAAVTRMLLAD